MTDPHLKKMTNKPKLGKKTLNFLITDKKQKKIESIPQR